MAGGVGSRGGIVEYLWSEQNRPRVRVFHHPHPGQNTLRCPGVVPTRGNTTAHRRVAQGLRPFGDNRSTMRMVGPHLPNAVRWQGDSDMDTLAEVVKSRARLSGGVGFVQTADRPQKDAARDLVLSLFTLESVPGFLSILTLPGLDWTFEHALLNQRGKKRTIITALERDPAVYAASIRNIPFPRKVKYTRQRERSLCSLWTPGVHRFHCVSVEDYAATADRQFDAAWLDFTGQLTKGSTDAIKLLWPLVGTLIVTSLNGRWEKRIAARVERAGSVNALVESLCPGTVLHSLTYCDTVSMAQIAIRKAPLEQPARRAVEA